MFEEEDIQVIAEKITEHIKPLLGNTEKEEAIFDKKALSKYIHVDVSWIDKNLYSLPHFKAGKYVRFRRIEVDKWIEASMKYPSPYLKLLKYVR